MRPEHAPVHDRILQRRPATGSRPARGRATAVEGVRFDPFTLQSAAAAIIDALGRGEGGTVITPNLDIVRQARRNPDVRRLVERADIRVADGMFIVWASRLQRTPLPERVTGADLSEELCRRAAASGHSVFLLGGNDGVAPRAARQLKRRFAGLRIAGTHTPPFGFESSATEMQRMRDALAAARPDIVLVGLGFPKQERTIEALRDACPDAWWLGIGITLSFMAGDVVRAPARWQNSGFEWLWRFTQEPGRLARRYFRHGIPFAVYLLANAGRKGLWARQRAHDGAR